MISDPNILKNPITYLILLAIIVIIGISSCLIYRFWRTWIKYLLNFRKKKKNYQKENLYGDKSTFPTGRKLLETNQNGCPIIEINEDHISESQLFPTDQKGIKNNESIKDLNFEENCPEKENFSLSLKKYA